MITKYKNYFKIKILSSSFRYQIKRHKLRNELRRLQFMYGLRFVRLTILLYSLAELQNYCDNRNVIEQFYLTV